MKKNYFLILIVLGFCSCQKELSNEGSNANTNNSTQVDVYVAGYVSDLSLGIPAYWKNGKLVLIDSARYNFFPDLGLQGARSVSIAVSGNNVYVTGYEIFQGPIRGGTVGIFWKNGVEEDVNMVGSQQLKSLAVSNSDVYMVGFREYIWGTGDPATYYKNGGNPIDILDGSAGSDATSMTVSGNDVYVAGVSITGNVFNGPQHLIAKYWKNGNPVTLTDGSKNAGAYSIAVVGSDVYVAGVEDNGGSFFVAKYWKNRAPVNLTDGTKYVEVNSIAVSGADVYVAGNESNGSFGVAKYWKNGNPVNLTDGTRSAVATSIVVSGNDVYVAGYEEKIAGSYDYVAKCWKNGNPVILDDVSKYSTSEAHSIFLVKR